MRTFILLVSLFLASACQTEKETKVPLIWNGVWELTEIAGQPVSKGEAWLEKPEVAHVSLEQKGKDAIIINGYSGCNGFGRTIEVGQPEMDRYVMATQRGCEKELSKQETNLFEILSGNPTFSFNGDAMTIEIKGENGKIARGNFLRKLDVKAP